MTKRRENALKAEKRRKAVMSVVLTVICIIYVLPVVSVAVNSFKQNTYVKTDTFALPNSETSAAPLLFQCESRWWYSTSSCS